MKLPARRAMAASAAKPDTHLWDLREDPRQERSIQDPEIEERMIGHLLRQMEECDAPPEQYERLGLGERLRSGG